MDPIVAIYIEACTDEKNLDNLLRIRGIYFKHIFMILCH